MIWLLLTILLGLQSPARDAVVAPRPGTGIIAGIVQLDDADARPLRRVVVTLNAGGTPLPRSAITDDAGRFAFTGIAPGNYTLQAARIGYVTAYYGARRPGRGPGIPISVADGQRVPDVTLKMLRGAVITGAVRLPGGKPASGLSVSANLLTMVNGQRQYDSGRVGTTDDRGEYRIFGLAPGDYLVQAAAPSTGTDMRRITAAEISAGQALLVPAGTAGPPLPAPDPGPSVSFAAVFFPGTTDVSAAQMIPLTTGQERGGVDFTLEYVRTARLSGTVIGADGRSPLNPRISLTPKNLSGIEAYFGSYNTVIARPDGSFSAVGITPGHYVLTARAAPAADAPVPSPAGPPGAPPIPPNGPVAPPVQTLWASTEFDVNGQDLSGLALRLQPGMTVSGKVTLDSTVAPLPDPTRTRLILAAVTAPGASAQEASFLAIGASSFVMEKDGSFAIKGVAPGTYRLAVTPPNALGGEPIPGMRTWTVKSVVVNGLDVADLPIQIKPGEDVTDVMLTLTDQPTEVSGTVLDNLNRPTAGFPIVVFAADRAYWPAGTARVRKVQPASNGKYTITGLPPGEYYVCAVTDVEPNDLKDVAFLESLATAAFKITLKPGEKRALDLKLGGGS
jgi:sarcosine oxidase gamma subunit